MIAVEKRVVSTMGFRQEADGRDVASEGRKLERRTSRAQQRREPSRMNECPRGDLGGKRKRGEEGAIGMLGEGSTTYRLSTHNHEGKGEKDPEIAIAQ